MTPLKTFRTTLVSAIFRQYGCFESFPFRQKLFIFVCQTRDFDGMLGTGLPVSMYTTKIPIDKCRCKVTQLKEFFAISVKDRYQLNYFICINDKTSMHSQLLL